MQHAHERRLHPRVDAGFRVNLRFSGGDTLFDCRTVNISQVAVQVEGDTALVDAFRQQEQLPQTCLVELRFPGAPIVDAIPCQLQNFRRLSQHAYTLVLMFTDIPETALDRLRAYLAAQA